ncbi:MAG: hypothetical protein CW691_11345, partial [Candidatus Bathyarchaeum sp.]
EIIVKFKQGSTHEQITSLKGKQGAEELMVSRFSGAITWKVPPSKTIEEWVNIFDNHPWVQYAEPNFVYSAFWVPNDPYYSHQWNFDDDNTLNPSGASSNPFGGTNGGGIRLEEAWETSKGTSEVVVAVLDTGVAYEDYSIPTEELDTVLSGVTNYQKASDLAGTSFWVNDDEIAGNSVDDDGNGFVDDVNGWDFVNNDAHPNDNNGHGTHVTGTIAQSTDNGLGVAGVSPNIVVMPIKVLNYKGDGTDIAVAEAIYYAANNGADIISLSLGGGDYSSTLEAAVAYAYNMGVVVIAASGNDGAGTVDYPAAYDSYVIAVGATRYDETLSYYSNYGSSLDVVAPGGDVTVDQNGDDYNDGILQQTFNSYYVETSPPYTEHKADPTDWEYWFYQGTSMATPHVSGVAALLLSQDPTLTPDQVRSVLQETAEDLGTIGRDNIYGYGLIDAKAAVFATLGPEFSCDETVKIMPLGDSITRGVPPWDNPTGYRQELYVDLINSGFNVDFVGSLTDGSGAFPPVFDTDHEGHGGWYANEIRDNVIGWLDANPADVVLLHIGTNDISAGDEYVVDEVEDILDNIDSYESANDKVILVVLARITLRGDEKNPETIALNDAVEAMAVDRIDAGDDIVIVDMQSALSHPDDFDDYLHPNSAGYQKMADVWYDTLDDLLPDCSGQIGLVHYWKLDETSETNYIDCIGNADATATGGEVPAPVSGVVDGAQNFDGTANRINSSIVSNPTSELTVMAWVKADSITGTDKGIIFKEGAFLFELESGESGSIDFTVMHSGETTELCPSDSTPIGEWVHYTGTFNGTHIAVYKNGSLLASTTVSGTIDSSTSPYTIGYSYFPGYETRYFDGTIDEVALFNKCLSAEEIQQLYLRSADGNSYTNLDPVANAGGPYTGTEGLPVYFDGSGSYDPDGTISTYFWTFGDGQTSVEQNPTHIYDQNGTYSVTLTVTDNESATDDVNTSADVDDVDPVANFSASITSGSQPLTIEFTDTSTSYDGIISWQWDFGDGETSIEQNPTHEYDSGTYTVSLTVHETDGESDIETKIDYIIVTTDSDPVVNYIFAWGHPGGRLDPAGSINRGERVHIYTFVSDNETPSDQLTVTIKYKAQTDPTWTETTATWEPTYNYWYYDWTIPEDATLGLYDVMIEVTDEDNDSTTSTEYGEFNIENAEPVV